MASKEDIKKIKPLGKDDSKSSNNNKFVKVKPLPTTLVAESKLPESRIDEKTMEITYETSYKLSKNHD